MGNVEHFGLLFHHGSSLNMDFQIEEVCSIKKVIISLNEIYKIGIKMHTIDKVLHYKETPFVV